MRQKFFVFALALALLLISLAGCSATAKTEKIKLNTTQETFSFKDDLGRTVKIKVPVKSVVSLAPSNTETLFALGVSKKIKGVTVFCNYPEEARKITKVGDFFNPNVELIIKLKPELVLAVKGIQNTTIQALEKNGIKVAVFEATSLDDCANDILTIGKLVGSEEKAKKIAESIKNLKKKYPSAGKKVFLEISPEPLITCGKNTFLSDAIEAAGGINAGKEFGEGYPIVNPEKLFQINPDVYLISKSLNLTPEDIKKRPGFENLKCVQEGKVFVVPDDDVIQRPGPRIVKGVEILHEFISR